MTKTKKLPSDNPPLSPEEITIATMFKALGDPTRLAILRFLEQCGSEESRTISDICLHITGTQKFTSTVAHHLKELRYAGLISIVKVGKTKECRLRTEAFGLLYHYLLPKTGISLQTFDISSEKIII